MSFERNIETVMVTSAMNAWTKKRDDFLAKASDCTYAEEKIVDGVTVKYTRRDPEAAIFESLARFCSWQADSFRKDLIALETTAA